MSYIIGRPGKLIMNLHIQVVRMQDDDMCMYDWLILLQYVVDCFCKRVCGLLV